MTSWKSPDEREVTRVHNALGRAYSDAVGVPQEFDGGTEPIHVPEMSPKAQALWEILRLSFAAWARFERRKKVADSARRKRAPSVLNDDKRRAEAIANVERALTLIRNAEDALRTDAEALQAEPHEGFEKDLKEWAERAERMSKLSRAVAEELAQLKTFLGIRQIWTKREWDTFISTSAETLLQVGFSSREVAALLTGTPEEKVNRATLERFRQRVRRRTESAG